MTYNKRDFPGSAMEPWDEEVKGPSKILRELYDLLPAILMRKLTQLAESLGEPFDRLPEKLHEPVPGFVDFPRESQGISW